MDASILQHVFQLAALQDTLAPVLPEISKKLVVDLDVDSETAKRVLGITNIRPYRSGAKTLSPRQMVKLIQALGNAEQK